MTGPRIEVQLAPQGWTHIGGPMVHALVALPEDDELLVAASDAADTGSLEAIAQVLAGERRPDYCAATWSEHPAALARGTGYAMLQVGEVTLKLASRVAGGEAVRVDFGPAVEQVNLVVAEAAADPRWAAVSTFDPQQHTELVTALPSVDPLPAGMPAPAPGGPAAAPRPAATLPPSPPVVPAPPVAVAPLVAPPRWGDRQAARPVTPPVPASSLPAAPGVSDIVAPPPEPPSAPAAPVPAAAATPVDLAALRPWSAVAGREATAPSAPATTARPAASTAGAQSPDGGAHRAESPEIDADIHDVESTWHATPGLEFPAPERPVAPEPPVAVTPASPAAPTELGASATAGPPGPGAAPEPPSAASQVPDAPVYDFLFGSTSARPTTWGTPNPPPAVPAKPAAQPDASVPAESARAGVAEPAKEPVASPPPAPIAAPPPGPAAGANGLISSVPWRRARASAPEAAPPSAPPMLQPFHGVRTPPPAPTLRPPTAPPVSPPPPAAPPLMSPPPPASPPEPVPPSPAATPTPVSSPQWPAEASLAHLPPPTAPPSASIPAPPAPPAPPTAAAPAIPPQAVLPPLVPPVPVPSPPVPPVVSPPVSSVAPPAPAGQPAAPPPAGLAYPATAELDDDPDATIDRAALNAQAVGPSVQAVLCPAGHPSPPHAVRCRRCGLEIPEQESYSTTRPPLGVLRIATGDSVLLDRGVLLGRNPRPDDSIPPGARPHVVKVDSPERDISRNHAEILLEGWHVLVRDLNSTNGTTITLPGGHPTRLRPGDQQVIEPGTVITLADEVSVVFEVEP